MAVVPKALGMFAMTPMPHRCPYAEAHERAPAATRAGWLARAVRFIVGCDPFREASWFAYVRQQDHDDGAAVKPLSLRSGAVPAEDPLVTLPVAGRIFEGHRRVRLGDASPGGRLRLDALARYLQDVSSDDTRDAGIADEITWVVRRLGVAVERFPVFTEDLDVRTFCSGTGPRWAERRVSVVGDRGGHVEAATLWVSVDGQGRPAALPRGFMELFGAAAAGRTVRARLAHPPPPPAVAVRPWALRFADIDVLGHVNNAAYWAAVEEVLAERRHLRAPLRAELEFRAPLERRPTVDVCVQDVEDGVRMWFTDAPVVFASVHLRRALEDRTVAQTTV